MVDKVLEILLMFVLGFVAGRFVPPDPSWLKDQKWLQRHHVEVKEVKH